MADANPTFNRIAAIAAGLAAALSLGSIAPVGANLAGLMATIAFVLLIAALQLVRPPKAEDGVPPSWAGGLVGGAASTILVVLGLLLVSAVIASVGGVRFLGGASIYLAEHFTIATGPFVGAIAVGVLMSALGKLAIEAPINVSRRIVSAGAQGVLGLLALLVALGAFGQPWHAPYYIAAGAVIAWLDAVAIAGVPTPARIIHWLEKGETAQTQRAIRTFVYVGGTGAIVLGVGAAAAHVLAMTTVAAGLEVGALILLILSTSPAAALRRAVPLELEDDVKSVQKQVKVLGTLALGPIVIALVGAVIAGVSFFTLGSPGSTIRVWLETARPLASVLIGALAGFNLLRARLKSHDRGGPLRNSVATMALSALAVSAFFALLVRLDIMAGPEQLDDVALSFDFLALAAAGTFVLVRGLYPIPGSKRFEQPEHERAEQSADEYKEGLERNFYFIYIAAAGFILVAMTLLSFSTFGGEGGFGLPASTAGRNAAFITLLGLGVVAILALAAVFIQSRSVKTPQEKKDVFKKKYTPHEVLRFTVLGVSISIAFILSFMGVMILTGNLTTLGNLELQAKHSTDFFVFGILIGIGPAGFLYNRERKRIHLIDQRLPEFLRDLAEGQRTGMTLTQAVITASRGNYGALTPEIRKMAAQLEWGIAFEDALHRFSQRVDTPLVQRTVSLVTEASNSGGNVIDVLTAASEDAREIQMIDAERKGGMQIYVMIIYIAFFVFIGVIAILNAKFMPEVAKAVAGASGASIGNIRFQEFDIQAFRTLFFHAAVVQGLGGGFVAGAMEEGKPVAGLKHAFAMTIIAYISFRFLLGG